MQDTSLRVLVLVGSLCLCYTIAEGIIPLERTQYFTVIYDAI